MLLHLLLVALFGNAPGGLVRPGEGGFGSLRVTLADGPPRAGATRPGGATQAESGPVGEGRRARVGGQVRPLEDLKVDDDAPGAARLGEWSETAPPLPTPAALAPRVVPPDTELAPLPPAPAAPELPAPRLAEAQPAPPTLDSIALSPLPALAAPALARARAPRVLRAEPAPPSPAAGPEALRPLAAPAAQDLAPLAALPEAPVFRPHLAAPAEELRAVGATGAVAPLAPIAPLAEAAAPAEAPGSAPALELPPPRLPAAAATPVPALPSSPALSPALPSVELPAAVRGDLPRAPALPPSPAGGSAERAEKSEKSELAGLRGEVPLPGASAGAPDAGARLGHDIATPAAQPADGARTRLDLRLPSGAAASSRSTAGALPLLPRPPERKSKLEQELEDAARADCRQAHADKGLLAAVPLVADALRGKGCRW